MNDNNLHIDKNDDLNFFSNAKPIYSRSKEEVLERITQEIELKPASKKISLSRPIAYSVAAAVVLLLSMAAFMRFYSQTIYSPRGSHLVYVLPDKSEVSLNADSKINFKPYWFGFNRSINLRGEAFFRVSKGNKFRVNSAKGTTEVLGTSFNIYSRDGYYKVDCYTGKVRVSSENNRSVILTPLYSAEIQDDGTILMKKKREDDIGSKWLTGSFSFNSVPLSEVFREVERQYNIIIDGEINPGFVYSGNFSAKLKNETVLSLLCKPFGLKFEKIGDNVYRIK